MSRSGIHPALIKKSLKVREEKASLKKESLIELEPEKKTKLTEFLDRRNFLEYRIAVNALVEKGYGFDPRNFDFTAYVKGGNTRQMIPLKRIRDIGERIYSLLVLGKQTKDFSAEQIRKILLRKGVSRFPVNVGRKGITKILPLEHVEKKDIERYAIFALNSAGYTFNPKNYRWVLANC